MAVDLVLRLKVLISFGSLVSYEPGPRFLEVGAGDALIRSARLVIDISLFLFFL